MGKDIISMTEELCNELMNMLDYSIVMWEYTLEDWIEVWEYCMEYIEHMVEAITR